MKVRKVNAHMATSSPLSHGIFSILWAFWGWEDRELHPPTPFLSNRTRSWLDLEVSKTQTPPITTRINWLSENRKYVARTQRNSLAASTTILLLLLLIYSREREVFVCDRTKLRAWIGWDWDMGRGINSNKSSIQPPLPHPLRVNQQSKRS